MISPALHLTLSWTFFIIAFASFILRVSIHQRYKRIFDRQLRNGDFAALAALLILLAYDILSTVTTRSLSYLSNNSQTESHDFRPDLADALSDLLQHQLPLTLLFTSGLWAVKFELLYLLHNMVADLRPLQRAWLCISAATAFTYLTSLLCYPISTVDCYECPSRKAIHLSLPLVRYNAAWDVITDFLIVALPQALAWRSSVTNSALFAASLSFVLARLPMMLAILRAAISQRESLVTEVLWLNTWSSIQVSMSMTLSNMMAPKQLRIARQKVADQRMRTNSFSLRRRSQDRGGRRWPTLALSRWSRTTSGQSHGRTEAICSPGIEQGN